MRKIYQATDSVELQKMCLMWLFKLKKFI